MFSGVWSQNLDIGFLIVIFTAVIFLGIRGNSEMEIDISFISKDQDELEQDGIHDLSQSSHSENLDYSRYYCESDSSPGPSHNIPQLDTESRSMSGSDSFLNPLHQIPQSDAESSSMCGSYDTISSDEELGDADDPVSKIWWKDNSKSGDSASVKNQDLIPEGDEDPNKSFFQLSGSLKDLRKQLLGDYVQPPEPPKHSSIPELTVSEIISLQHYMAWWK